MADLKIDRVFKRFGAVDVLSDVNLDISQGEFVVFVGPSGCGKSTLLRLICGLEEVSSGDILIDGDVVNDAPPANRGVAMVFQSYALYPHMTVAENMGYALRLARTPKAEIAEKVRSAADALQLTPYLDRKPRQLSGGQRQRVAIGRAIVREPKIFLFDEPLSNLDAALRVDMRMEFARMKARLAATMVYVTHDQVEAMTLADKIVVMNGGRIEQVGAPIELYARPANRFVAGFIGSPKINFFPVSSVIGDRIETAGGSFYMGRASLGDAPAELGVRPEHLRIADGVGDGVLGAALTSERLGSDTFVYVDVAGLERPVTVRIDGAQSIEPGAHLRLTADPEAIHLFDASGRALPKGDAAEAA